MSEATLLSAILDFILAPICLGCDRPIHAGDSARLVCRVCRSKLQPPPPPSCERCGASLPVAGRTRSFTCTNCERWPPAIRFARSACLLHAPADRLVYQLKYNGWRALGAFMGERLLGSALPDEVREECALVVPVSTTAERERERGYNQAQLLADAFAQRSGRKCLIALQRAHGGTQTALQPLARAANVAGAFQLSGSHPQLDGQHVLLIDDVLTTGATVSECALALVAGGARCVSVLTFARALDARRLTGT